MLEFQPLREELESLAGRQSLPDFGELKHRVARRRRRRRGMVGAALVAVISGYVLLLGGPYDIRDRIPPAGEPAPASADPNRGSEMFFESELRRVLVQVPNWAITDSDPTILYPCGGDWSSTSSGGGGGSITIRTQGEGPSVWSDTYGFSSAGEAAMAVAALEENLTACTSVAWRIQPIGQTPAVLASSASGVIWIHQTGDKVGTLQVPTTDGPPPPDVQIEVNDLIRSRMS